MPCMFKHAAAAFMGVGGVTVPSTANPAATAFMGVGGVMVPSTATPLETALMAFMQQNAADRSL